jgi:hypothetical protein
MTREKKSFHQRQKGTPITYDGSVAPIPLAYVSQEWPDKLTLKINASPEDWDTLHQLADSSPEYLGRLIFLHITRPVQEKFLSKEGRNLPRGFHNEAEQIFMEESRRYAAAAFAVLSHWAKSPLTDWPDYLKAEMLDAEKRLGKTNIWHPEKESVVVIAVVRYLLKLKFGRRGIELGLKDIEDIDNMDNSDFRKIYFDKKKIDAAVAIQNNFIKRYGNPITIDTLYEVVPGFGWEPIKE